MADACLILFAKSPEVGQVKTRLCPPLSHSQAAEVYRAFLQDTTNACVQLKGVHHVLTYAGNQTHLRTFVRTEWEFIPQAEGDLGARLIHASRWAFAEGYRRVLIIGSDSPGLPVSYFEEALELLRTHEIVLGPSTDGGYYLIGLGNLQAHTHRWIPQVYENVEWSTAHVFQQTLDQLDSSVRLALLPPWYDIDTIDDLQLLKTHLKARLLAGDEALPLKTLHLLETLHVSD